MSTNVFNPFPNTKRDTHPIDIIYCLKNNQEQITSNHITDIIDYVTNAHKMTHKWDIEKNAHEIINHIITNYLSLVTQSSLNELLWDRATSIKLIDNLIAMDLNEENANRFCKLKMDCKSFEFSTWFHQPHVYMWHFKFLHLMLSDIKHNWDIFWNKINKSTIVPPVDFVCALVWDTIYKNKSTNEYSLNLIPISWYTSQNLQTFLTYISSKQIEYYKEKYDNNFDPDTKLTIDEYHPYDNQILAVVKKFASYNILVNIKNITSILKYPYDYHLAHILIRSKYFTPTPLTAQQFDLIIAAIRNTLQELTISYPKIIYNKRHSVAIILCSLLEKCGGTFTHAHAQDMCMTNIEPTTFAKIIKLVGYNFNEIMFINSIKMNNIPMIEWFLSNKCSPKEDYVYKCADFEQIDKIILLFVQYGLPITMRLYVFANIMGITIDDIGVPQSTKDVIARLKETEERKSKTENKKAEMIRKYKSLRKVKIVTGKKIQHLRQIFESYDFMMLCNAIKEIKVVPDETCYEAALHNSDHRVIKYVYDTYDYIPQVFDIMRIADFKMRFYSLCRFYPNLACFNLTLDMKIEKVSVMYDAFGN